jgi:hypothetical protein
MTNAVSTGNTGVTLPDSPPNIVVVRAQCQAKALARCVYVYRCQSNWVMTTDLSEPPSDAAVWMFAANQNDPDRQNWGGN